MVQFLVAPWAARVRIEQNGGFVHASARSALSLAYAPLPHAEHNLLRDGVSGSAGVHGDLGRG
jgi:6-phosphogluconolactonase (cycloisomerase 2 family)